MASMIIWAFTSSFMSSEIVSTSLLPHKGEYFQLKIKLRKPLDKWNFGKYFKDGVWGRKVPEGSFILIHF